MVRRVTIAVFVAAMFAAQVVLGQNYTGATTAFPGCGTSGCHDVAARPEFGQWIKTAHAQAYDSAAAIVQQTDRCLQCHTTGWDLENANLGADDFVTIDPNQTTFNVTVNNPAEFAKKTNVQCEACHGPVQFGVNHPPRKTITVDDCASCHQGEHHPYVEEWNESQHATSTTHPVPSLQDRFRNNPNCSGCHTQQGFIQFVGTTAEDTLNFVPAVVAPGDAALPIDCATCHDPHDAIHVGQLRMPAAQLCIKCHNPQDAEPPDIPRHSTSSMWAGTGAVEFEGYAYRNQSVHQFVGATAEKACVACHVFQTPFDAGPPVKPAATGHTFEPRIEACMQAGCHVDGLVDTGDRPFNHRNRQNFTDSLVAVLQDILANATSEDSLTSDFEAGLFNLRFVQNSGSHGVHNAVYAEDILVNTIAHLRDVLVSVESLPGSGIPAAFDLHQNYPNPFNPVTKIRFDVAAAGQVKLVVFNSIGQVVQTLVDERLTPKVYEVSFDASNLPSGIYFYRLTTESGVSTTKKMVLVR